MGKAIMKKCLELLPHDFNEDITERVIAEYDEFITILKKILCSNWTKKKMLAILQLHL